MMAVCDDVRGWHRPFGTADLLMCQETILDHWAMTTLVAGCREEEMVQKPPQLKGLLSTSFGKTLYSEAGVSFKLTRLRLQRYILRMAVCRPPAELCVP